jgi:uncharacterized RDD family membrane protein YckC
MQAEYKIIGGDGIEYGPATLEELRSWIRDGRVAGMTQVWRSDVGAWSPATGYTELGGDLARLHGVSVASAKPCGFWARLGAYIIDAIIISAIFQLVWTQSGQSRLWPMPIFPTVITDAAFQQFLREGQAWFNHAAPYFYPIYFLYDVLFNGRFGATVGKMAIGARIVMWDGAPLTYRRAALRWLAARVSDLFFFAGYVLIALRADKRALHDLLAGTRVIYKR